MEAEVSALKCISPVVTYHGLHMLDSLLIKIFDIGNRFIFFKFKKKICRDTGRIVWKYGYYAERQMHVGV